MSRTYDSTSRVKSAAKTKDRILKAALSLFKKEGFQKVSINKIAKVAEVSAPTIYAVFKSKQGILEALTEEALPKNHFDDLVEQSIETKDPKKRLQISAKIARSIYDGEKKQMELFKGLGLISPELKKLEDRRELRRHKRQKITIDAMKKEGSLSTKLSVKKARDILWALTGRDMYHMLVVRQKWTSETYELWLYDTLISSLRNL